MSASLLIGCIWVVVAAITALLPMRHQYPPGITLLVAAPFVIGFIGYEHGWIWVVLALFAFVSMFRRPCLRWSGGGGAR
ncbi:DUF2484 family protein [Actibacterium pelagium]|uniref:DUF2484 family protein n=1 Tax=Actibacterium pelagium TaxID=2029103 RepID=UPI000BAAFFEE|nr:DUF2484 family protein [Actibacterium pelagium]